MHVTVCVRACKGDQMCVFARARASTTLLPAPSDSVPRRSDVCEYVCVCARAHKTQLPAPSDTLHLTGI